jgi:hypothetical protein
MYVMKTVTCKELRQMIAVILSTSIDEIRATKDNQFFYEFDMPPTDDEVDAFIKLSCCFDDEMKEFLLSEVGCAMVEDKRKINLALT